jgi:hypothetical protein
MKRILTASIVLYIILETLSIAEIFLAPLVFGIFVRIAGVEATQTFSQLQHFFHFFYLIPLIMFFAAARKEMRVSAYLALTGAIFLSVSLILSLLVLFGFTQNTFLRISPPLSNGFLLHYSVLFPVSLTLCLERKWRVYGFVTVSFGALEWCSNLAFSYLLLSPGANFSVIPKATNLLSSLTLIILVMRIILSVGFLAGRCYKEAEL